MDEIREALKRIGTEARQAQSHVPPSNKGSDNLWEIRRLASETLTVLEAFERTTTAVT